MEGNRVAEVRGVEASQNLEPELLDTVAQKLETLPGGGDYIERVQNTKRMSEIFTKWQRGIAPDKEDLRFMYLTDQRKVGFAHTGGDKRLEAVLNNRDTRQDIVVALDLEPSQISLTTDEALSGGIVYHYGSLNLRSLTSAEGLTLPQTVSGGLYLDSLTSAERHQLKTKHPHIYIH